MNPVRSGTVKANVVERIVRAGVWAGPWLLVLGTAALVPWLPIDVLQGIPFAIPASFLAWQGRRLGAVLVVTLASLLPVVHPLFGGHTVSRSLLEFALVAFFAGLPVAAVGWLRSRMDPLRASVDALERRAFHDRLTQLPNRALLVDRLAMAIEEGRRTRCHVAVLFLDLDGFKAVNDDHGHKAGDELLVAVAHRLRSCVRATDTVARTGGDEFVIVLGHLGEPRDALTVAAKVHAALGHPIAGRDGREYRIGASLGVSYFPEHGAEIDRLIDHADTAMYLSKLAGKNRTTVFAGAPADQADEPWFRFGPEHEIGIADIDDQHRHLMQIAERFNAAIKARRSEKDIARLFEELVGFVRHHFQTEEQWMARYGYPGLEVHRKLHEGLLDEVGHIRERLAQAGELVVVQTIKDWLLDHIETADRAMGAYIAGQRVEATAGTPGSPTSR